MNDNAVVTVQQRENAPEGQRVWDTIVIGAGPAGSVAAEGIAKAGGSVLLLDRERFPRAKTCGDGLIGDAQRALARIGLLDEVRRRGHVAPAMEAWSPSQHCGVVAGEYITLKRSVLDTLIARKAVEAGAVFARASAASILTSGQRVLVTVKDRSDPLLAKTVVIATGASPLLSRRVPELSEPRHDIVALRQYVRSPVNVDHLIISWDRSITPGYLWVFPMGNGEYNVGVGISREQSESGINLRDAYRRALAALPLTQKLMSAATDMTPLQGAPLSTALDLPRVRSGKVLAAGEAINATFPLTGEGIGKAMETGMFAAIAILRYLASGDEGDLSYYERVISEELRPRYHGYKTTGRWLAVPGVVDFVMKRLDHSAFLQEAVKGVLDERPSTPARSSRPPDLSGRCSGNDPSRRATTRPADGKAGHDRMRPGEGAEKYRVVSRPSGVYSTWTIREQQCE